VTATFSGMTIQNGHGNLRESMSAGGGIMNYGTTTVENCIIKNNYADDSGGGIFNYYDPIVDPTSSLIVKKSQFIENSAFRNGGAIFTQGPLTISKCIFNKNTAALDPSANALGGGAIANPLGQLTVSNSIFIDNIANSGGAIFNADSATAEINHCTLRGTKPLEIGACRRALEELSLMDTIQVAAR
jgi:fibronectin-binding autotransporter adhesin